MEFFSPSKQIAQGVEEQDIKYKILDSVQAQYLRKKIRAKYGDSSGSPFWQYIGESSSVQDSLGWRHINRFVRKEEFIFFFDESDDTHFVEIGEGCNAASILDACSGFVFYLTNHSLDYLLCFNDHDFLIGAGTARAWVESLTT